MKIKITVSLFFLLVTSIGYSQVSENQSGAYTVYRNNIGYFSINVGPSIPLSDFSRKDPSSDASGYAKLGYCVEGDINFRLAPLFTLGLTSYFNSNPTDLQALIDDQNAKNPGTSWSGKANNWYLYGILGGFGYSYPVAPKVRAELKGLAGFLNAKSPEFLITAASGSDVYTLKIEEKSVNTWSYIFSVNLAYSLSDRLSALGKVEFIGSQPRFDNVKTTISTNGIIIDSSDESFRRHISTLIIGAGLRYAF